MSKDTKEKKNRRDHNEELFLSCKAIADLFNRSDKTIREWITACNPPRIGPQTKPRYYLPDILKYFLEHIYQPIPKEYEKVKLEREKVKLEKERLDLEVAKGRLVERDAVEIEWAQRVVEFRQGLIALEFKLAKKLAGRKLTLSQVRKTLREEIFEILRAYAREGEYTPQALGIPTEKFEQAYFQFLDQLKKADCTKPKVAVKCNGKANRKRKKSA